MNALYSISSAGASLTIPWWSLLWAKCRLHIKQEDVKLRDHYGRNDLGQSCLLARRLVEAGVTYITIQAGGGWDTHGDNFKQLKKQSVAEIRSSSEPHW